MSRSIAARGPLEVTRRDPTTGTTERIAFLGPPGERLYSCHYRPSAIPLGGVVICPSVHAEFTGSYGREVLLARRLAEAGFAVQRFHYRGTGNSDGTGREVTFDSMREDAQVSLGHLRSEVAGPVCLLGTRWGAMVAASAAAFEPEAPLVLWEPLVEGWRFFREAFRSMMVAELRDGVDTPTTGEEYVRRLEAGASVDIVGHTIEPALYASWVGRKLTDEVGSTPRSILVAQIGPSDTTPPELTRAAEAWRAARFDVEVRSFRGERSSWLVDERWHNEASQSPTATLIADTIGWIRERTVGSSPTVEAHP